MLAVGLRVRGEEIDYTEADGAIGYRSLAVLERGALFPFGHGLGYSVTECSCTVEPLPDGSTQLDVRVQNLGDRATTHVAQVYAQFEGELSRELIAFRRIKVAAGDAGTAQIIVRPTDLSRWTR